MRTIQPNSVFLLFLCWGGYSGFEIFRVNVYLVILLFFYLNYYMLLTYALFPSLSFSCLFHCTSCLCWDECLIFLLSLIKLAMENVLIYTRVKSSFIANIKRLSINSKESQTKSNTSHYVEVRYLDMPTINQINT